MVEAADADIEFSARRFSVKGTDRAVDLFEVAAAARWPWGPYREGYSLRPESSAAIERAPKSPLGIAVRDVTYAADEAWDMLDYFRSAADILTTLGSAYAGACADAFDNIQHGLGVVGIKCSN